MSRADAEMKKSDAQIRYFTDSRTPVQTAVADHIAADPCDSADHSMSLPAAKQDLSSHGVPGSSLADPVPRGTNLEFVAFCGFVFIIFKISSYLFSTDSQQVPSKFPASSPHSSTTQQDTISTSSRTCLDCAKDPAFGCFWQVDLQQHTTAFQQTSS